MFVLGTYLLRTVLYVTHGLVRAYVRVAPLGGRAGWSYGLAGWG